LPRPFEIAVIAQPYVVMHLDVAIVQPARGPSRAVTIVRLNQHETLLHLSGVLRAINATGFDIR
jgi:hypothetical protein